MQDFRKLRIFQRSMEFCTQIYAFSSKLPSSERFGLTSQIRRAASSIPLNISEGAGTVTNKEFALFVSYSYRSINEVLTCLELIKRLNLTMTASNARLLEQEGIILSKIIYTFFQKLSRK